MAPNLTAIVVDNASSDQTVRVAQSRALREQVQVISNLENRGFAAAVNQGIAASNADFLLLLNPDANLLTGVDALIHASQQYGLSAGKLIGRSEGALTIRRLPTPTTLIFELFGINRLWPFNPVNRRYRYLDRDLDRPGPVEQPAGAFLMTRRDVWERLRGFDETFYPVWFEDVDFCQRALHLGYRIEYVPSVQASHLGGHSVDQISPGPRAVRWCVSLTRYAAKHFHSAGYRAVCLAVVLSSFPRMVARMIQDRSLQSVATYRKIVLFAGLCLVSPGRSTARGGRNFKL